MNTTGQTRIMKKTMSQGNLFKTGIFIPPGISVQFDGRNLALTDRLRNVVSTPRFTTKHSCHFENVKKPY